MQPTPAPARARPLLAALALSCLATAAVADGLDSAGGEAAAARYAEVLDAAGGGFQRPVGAAVVVFDPAETEALVAAGWQPSADTRGFRDLGERVTTFVAIAEALGMDPAIGALQANWGTPQENGIAELAENANAARYARDVARYDIAELERHRADALAVLEEMQARATAGDPAETADTVAALEAEIASVDARLAELRAQEEVLTGELAALENELAAAMGKADETMPVGWATADLDVNGDGTVDRADLKAALDGAKPAEGGAVVQ